jgi:hypothetical protein
MKDSILDRARILHSTSFTEGGRQPYFNLARHCELIKSAVNLAARHIRSCRYMLMKSGPQNVD